MILYNPKPWIRCYSMKWLLNSYCQYSLILTFRPIWGFWRCSELIPHTNKHGVWHQNQVSSTARSKVRNFLLEVVLDLLHPILDIQVNLMPLKMVPNDSPCQKTWGLTPKPWFNQHFRTFEYCPKKLILAIFRRCPSLVHRVYGRLGWFLLIFGIIWSLGNHSLTLVTPFCHLAETKCF